MIDSVAKSIPLTVVSGSASEHPPLQSGVKQLGSDKINRSPVHFADAPLLRYWTPDEFKQLEAFGMALGFAHVASGPLVRSSYHADRSAMEAGVLAPA